jgi:lysophospholipid acyltransferase (LPLAT)-like uncharacterized protein
MAIRVDPTSRRGSLALRVAATFARLVVGALGRTCRLEVVHGAARIDDLLAGGDTGSGGAPPVILCFWHERVILGAYFFRRHLVRRGLDTTILISQSRDGEMVANLASQWGFAHIRGSASRGGSAALRAVYRAIRRGSSPVMIPDGPRGPAHEFKVGVGVLSQMAERPVLPMAFAASGAWRIRSWDRLFIPKPFSRVVVAVGAPHTVPRNLDSEGLEAERLRLEQMLNDITATADRAVAPRKRA